MGRRGIPDINETVAALRSHFAHGATGAGPANMSLETRRGLAGGGATAGLKSQPISRR
jgi:hypothetical protein